MILSGGILRRYRIYVNKNRGILLETCTQSIQSEIQNPKSEIQKTAPRNTAPRLTTPDTSCEYVDFPIVPDRLHSAQADRFRGHSPGWRF